MDNLEKDLFIKIDVEDKKVRKNFLSFLEKSIECLTNIEDMKEGFLEEKESLKKIKEKVGELNYNFKILQEILPLAKEKKVVERKKKEVIERKGVVERKKKEAEKKPKIKEVVEKKTKKMKLMEELEQIRKKLSSM